MSGGPMFSRAELVGGLPARRASTITFAIEAQVARLRAASRIDRATYVGERTAAQRESEFLGALASGRDLPRAPGIRDLERFSAGWASLVPASPDERAAVARMLAAKHRFRKVDVPRLRAALGLDDGPVAATFERLFGEPLDSIYVPRLGPLERLRWRLGQSAARFDTLPPFWIAFFLALTETLGEGIMSVPLALAGLGPLPGVVLLVVLGLINLVTMGALTEAVTRNGSMRYGTAYFGRLVTELLGYRPALSLSIALLLFNAVTLLVYLLGFASVLTGATGIPEWIWVALLFLANLWFLRHETLDDTIASAVVIGVVNLALVVGIVALALGAVQPANLAYMDVPFTDGRPVDPAIVGLVFGVLLVAFFGHTSAANASKLVLTLEPSGRALLFGNLAALGTIIVLYCVATVAILGAVGPEPLLATRGTSITPLAEAVGPAVNVLGSIYVVLAIGLGSLYVTLGLYNQVIELLPRPAGPSTGNSRLARVLRTRRGRLAVGMAPAAGVFVLLELLVLAEQDWFAGPIAIVGVLAVPLITGIFPMLLVRAARNKGEYVPGRVIRLVGHPVTVAALVVFFVAAVALHGLVIWDGALERAAAIAVAIATVVIVLATWRGGAFRRRAVVELRADRKPRRSTLSVTAHGQTLVAASPVEAGTPVRATVPPGAAEELRIWVHEVTEDGWSIALPATVVVQQGDRVSTLRIEDADAEPIPLDSGPTTITITPAAVPSRNAGR
jgi:amino acid permease